MKFIGNTNEYLDLLQIEKSTGYLLEENFINGLTILWFKSSSNILVIDGKEEMFSKDQILFLTEFHKVTVQTIGEARMLRFNRPFYCILDHDTEVGCKGALFFGAARLPKVSIKPEELDKLETLWKMFTQEMNSQDSLQVEMLQMMLKRYLILCVRMFKEQEKFPLPPQEEELVRNYNFLVEQHFRTKHQVADYAELLYKSPKTLANTFLKMGSRSPLQFIQDRIMLEARRQLVHTDKHIGEIAQETGFQDIQTFSRFFRKQEGISPSEFRKGIIVKSPGIKV